MASLFSFDGAKLHFYYKITHIKLSMDVAFAKIYISNCPWRVIIH